MKKYIIPKGFHRPLRLLPAFLRCRPTICDAIKKYAIYESRKRIIFTESCRYSLDNGDQSDWNKLFGFCFGVLGIHRNSLRAVWRYNPETDLIDVAMYYYIDGERNYNICTSVPVNTICNVTLIYEKYDEKAYLSVSGVYSGSVMKNASFPVGKPVFGCGLYFGGNRRAPQKITIYEY